jgi:hypothetical protein
MTIHFTNPGEIDIRAVTIMGVNVKESPSSIGFFGTGLKYALATLLRENQEITIYSGLNKYTFHSVQEEIRGKTFNIIHISENHGDPRPLGFTTELGKNWTLQHAYRELYSNMMDEGGEFDTKAWPTRNRTIITVHGTAFLKTHNHRKEFLLPPTSKPLYILGDIEVHLGRTNKVFYKGIAAGEFHRQTLYTYNITSTQKLTEDRTLSELWYFEYKLAGAYSICKDPSLISTVLSPGEDSYEHQLNFSNSTLSAEFLAEVMEEMKTNSIKLNPTIRAKFFSQLPNVTVEYKDVKLCASDAKALETAVSWLEALGFHISKFPIRVVESLGINILGLARAGVIYLDPRVFALGQLRETLLEEYTHLAFDVNDETLQMQNVLFNEIISLGERYHELLRRQG